MKPKLSIWPLALVLLLTLGAATVTSIKWYNDATIPEATSIANGNVFSLQSTGPNAFKWAYASTLKNYMGVSQTIVIDTNYVMYGMSYVTNDPVVNNYFNTNIFLDQSISNYFYTYSPVYETHQTNVTINEYLTQNTSISNTVITNIYASTVVSNWITTNVFPTTVVNTTNLIGGAFIANLGGLGTNTTLYGDTILAGAGVPGQFELYDATGLIPIAGFNGVYFWGNGLGLTNLNVPSGSNYFYQVGIGHLTVTNTYITTNYVNQEFVTNGIAFKTNLWAGATNTVSMALQKQFYQSYTPCQVTGFTDLRPGFVQSASLYLKNISDTNWTFLPPANTTGTNHAAAPAVTVTTNQWAHIWFEACSDFTNMIVQGF